MPSAQPVPDRAADRTGGQGMDLNAVSAVQRPASRAALEPFQPGDSFVAGGTWLYSEPQRHLRRLIDLSAMGWPALVPEAGGLTIAATCTVAELADFGACLPDAQDPHPQKRAADMPDWQALPLFGLCCRSFLASFKIWKMATVGGNLCMGLPAGPMISLTAALDGICRIWSADGGEHEVPVVDFVHGPLDVALAPGEVLRAIHLPADHLRRRFAFRRASLWSLGRSGVLLIGTLGSEGLLLTVTAATRRPVQIAFRGLPGRAELASRIEAAIPQELYYDDHHGRPDWRRFMTHEFAAEICDELAQEEAR